jgi:hypothetical protein
VIRPRSGNVAGGDKKCEKVASGDRKIPQMQNVGDDRKTGVGENLPELPDSSLFGVDTSLERCERDLRRISSSLPVENLVGNQIDTKQNYKTCTAGLNGARGQRLEITREKQDTGKLTHGEYRNQRGTKRDHVIGFVPIQVVNLLLEEMEMPKNMCVGVASPTENYDVTDFNIQDVYALQGRTKGKVNEEVSEQYSQEKLGHLTGKDQKLLGDILRKYCHLFYELGSREIGCTCYVKHTIDTGDASPINPYRIPHALKSVVDEHIGDMLAKGIIEPSASPWSSSIVLVQKKTKDGSIKYRFCIER